MCLLPPHIINHLETVISYLWDAESQDWDCSMDEDQENPHIFESVALLATWLNALSGSYRNQHACPQCGRVDGVSRFGGAAWLMCHAHQLKWKAQPEPGRVQLEPDLTYEEICRRFLDRYRTVVHR